MYILFKLGLLDHEYFAFFNESRLVMYVCIFNLFTLHDYLLLFMNYKT